MLVCAKGSHTELSSAARALGPVAAFSTSTAATATMGLLATMSMSPRERTAHAIATMEPAQLPPVLALLATVLAGAGLDDEIALLDLAGESVRFGGFLLEARPNLTGALEQLQASMASQMVRGHRGPLTTLVLLDPSSGQVWTRERTRECLQCIEHRIGAAAAAEARELTSGVAADGRKPLGVSGASEVLRELLAARENET